MPRHKAVLTSHRQDQKWNFVLFQISVEILSRLKKKVFPFLVNFGICFFKNHIAKLLELSNECGRFFLSSQKTFFCRNLKKWHLFLSFLVVYNVATASRHLGPLLLRKSLGVWGWFYSRNFSSATFYVFWAMFFDLFAHEANLKN